MTISSFNESHLEWGASSLSLGPAIAAPPGLEWADWRECAVLDRFFRSGGEDAPVTPTEARFAWDDAALYVGFRCAEPDLNHPALRHESSDLFALAHKPNHLDSAFPDRVDIVVRPSFEDAAFFQFCLTLEGESDAQRFSSYPFDAAEKERVVGYKAGVRRENNAWIARFAVPWALLGGRAERFGLLPSRTRWRDSQRLSPVALDFTDRPAPDLLLETSLGGVIGARSEAGALITLPSGVRLWQRPAILTWPSGEEYRAVWQTQQGLSEPTTLANLAERLHMAQRWSDLLTLEGFNFRVESGSPVEAAMIAPSGEYQTRGALRVTDVRREVNLALRSNDVQAAATRLDEFLRRLDAASRRWFADESPGNLRDDAWTSLDTIERLSFDRHEVHLHGRAGPWPVTLDLSCPAEPCGGVRLHAGTIGLFEPGEREILDCQRITLRVSRPDEPWAVEIAATGEAPPWRLQAGDVRFRFDTDGQILASRLALPLAPEEVVYGFGERYNALNQRGQVLTLWGLDDFEGLIIGLRRQTYKPIPLLHSTRPYTLFLNTAYRLRADVGRAREDRCDLTTHGPIFDLYLWPQSPREALRAYTGLTGKPLLPPRWAFEPWMGGGSGRWRDGPHPTPAENMIDVARRFADLDIPHAVLFAEGSGCEDPRLHTALEPLGVRVLSWMNQSIAPEKIAQLLPDVAPEDWPVLHREGGKVYESKHSRWPYLDHTHPRAAELLRAFWKRRLDLGMAGSMVDFGDQVPEDARFHDGRSGAAMHNFYADGYHRAFNRAFAERRGPDFALFCRSASPGSQRWGCHFSGDHRANFDGIRAALRGALSLGACGFSNWSVDMGGYFGWPDPESYARWVAWTCFTPLMRSHGTEPREPWEYDADALPIYKRFAWIRHNLQDYIYAAAVEAHHGCARLCLIRSTGGRWTRTTADCR